MTERDKFEVWVVEKHTKQCAELGLSDSKEGTALVEDVNKYLVKKWKDGEYKDDEIEAQWQAWQAAIAHTQKAPEPVKPEYFWNKGDEYTMQDNGEVSDWASDNDILDGDSFSLEYAITGTAEFIVQDDNVKLVNYSPKYCVMPASPTEQKGEIKRTKNLNARIDTTYLK